MADERPDEGLPPVSLLGMDSEPEEQGVPVLAEPRRSAARHRAFFENLQEVVNVFEALCDAQGRAVDWVFRDANRASLQALGLERAQLLGRRASEVLGEGADFYLGVFRRVYESGEPWAGEASLAGRDYFSRVFALGDNRLASTRIDVTESKRTEAALRASEAEYRGLFALAQRRRGELEAVYDAMSDGVMVFDPAGRVILANEAAARLFGYHAPEALRRQASWFAREFELDAPEGRSLPLDDWPLSRLLRGESIGHVELWTRRRDTGREWLVGYSGGPVLDDEGRLRLAVLIMRDVTQQRRAEEALRDSTALLRTISDASADAIFAKDGQGRLRYANPATLAVFGRPAAEVLGKTDLQLFEDPEAARRIMENDRRIMASGQGEEVEETVPLADGSVRVWLSRKTPFSDDDQRVAGLLGIARDITERKQAEAALQRANEQLREADRHKDDFLAVLSHELRNPLAPIRNSVYVLEHAAPESEQARRAREVIDRQTRHLARLVDDLLDVTRIARGKVKLQRAPLDLCEVVKRTCEDLRETFVRAGVRLEVEASGSFLVDGDRTRLAQVLENLLGNAAKFTPEGGRTRVRAMAGGPDQAVVDIEDDGIGIAPAMLPLLFEPFVQVEESLDRSRGGLGLGLALVKGLVEMHGGSITASSEGLGRGARFTVRLPCRPQPVVSQPPGEQPAPARMTARRVLVIEDNRDAGESLVEALELTGHTVEVAHSGPEGLARARTFAPEVVLCDIGLPGMTGFDVARAMRADTQLRSTRLVALTGYALEDDVRRGTRGGLRGPHGEASRPGRARTAVRATRALTSPRSHGTHARWLDTVARCCRRSLRRTPLQ